MRERFTTLESLAVEIGHSPTWVARRLNLLNLSELWKKAMEEKIFGYMTVSHYETIATFPPRKFKTTSLIISVALRGVI